MAVENWRGDEIRRQLRGEMGRRVRAACITLQNHAKQLISIPGTSPGGIAGPRTKRVYGSFPSAPGEPPHKQFGRLRASVTYETDDMIGRVGTNVEYGRHLELGTQNMAARPWLRRSLAECRDAIRRILGAPIRF